jgi:catalase
MNDLEPTSRGSAPLRLVAIAAIVGTAAAAFAGTAGWLTPDRLTPSKVVDSLAPASGPAVGHRRNHAKGVCFTGTFESNGAASALSEARMFASGNYPVTGRFNLAGPDPRMADGTGRVRGLGLSVRAPGPQEWRTAMIDAPFFPAATVQDFYDLQVASAKKDDPGAMKAYAAAHPALRAFGAWAGSAPFTESWTEDRFNSLDSFLFTNGKGQRQAVRWSFVPVVTPVAVPAADLKTRDPDFLAHDLVARVGQSPQKWTLQVTLANAGDATADPSQAWPVDRRTIDAGTLVVSRIEAEAGGPCRDLNFDPTILPAGMATSDDPFPAARSAAYAVSYDRRTAEAKDYPKPNAGGQP